MSNDAVLTPAEQGAFFLSMCESMGVPFEQASRKTTEMLRDLRDDPEYMRRFDRQRAKR